MSKLQTIATDQIEPGIYFLQHVTHDRIRQSVSLKGKAGNQEIRKSDREVKDVNSIEKEVLYINIVAMRILIGFMFVSFAFATNGQRVAVDLNSAFSNMYTTALYCHIFKPTWYIKAGVSGGNYGRGYFEEDLYAVRNGEAMISPYSEVNNSPFPGMLLCRYGTRHKGGALEVGIGKFIEIGPIHTLRFDFQLKGYNVKEEIWAAYASDVPDSKLKAVKYTFRRNLLSAGPEVFHAIRMSARLTIYYGFKIPFYLPIRTEGYHPSGTESKSLGFRPNMTVGMSCAIIKKKAVNTE